MAAKIFRQIFSIIILIAIFVFTVYSLYLTFSPREKKMEILLITHHELNAMEENIKNAYISVLEEEGVRFKWITRGDLWRSTPRRILLEHQVLIFPDFVTQKIPKEFEVWVEEYVSLGGNVFIVYNSGTMTENRGYREQAVFTRLLGMNYVTYNKYQSLAFQMAKVRFKDRNAADFFEIPHGKIDELNTITGYQYGALDYPLAKVDISFIDDKNVLIYSLYQDGKSSPNTFWKKMGGGNVLYTNLPLGYLKAYGTDDLLLRTFLRAFLFKIAVIPHLCNTPYNRGGVVLNWHVDDNREHNNTIRFEKVGLFRTSLPASFHITAGDYLSTPGDNKGFDAASNPQLVRKLMKYGTIGSHGGWAHNWFADKLLNNEFTESEIEHYINLNNQVLSLITNYPIVEYAAPKGVHPQPQLTAILKKMGMKCYYYPGDMGSRPNRTFSKGIMVSDELIAFPVMPMGKNVSVMELGIDGVSSADYKKWLNSNLDYLVRNHTIFLIYSHFYDYHYHEKYIIPFIQALDRMEKLQYENKLIVQTMEYFTDFIHRFLKTEYVFIIRKDMMVVELQNSAGLDGISVAIPKKLCRRPPGSGFYLTEDSDYFYVNITDDVYEKNIVCHLH